MKKKILIGSVFVLFVVCAFALHFNSIDQDVENNNPTFNSTDNTTDENVTTNKIVDLRNKYDNDDFWQKDICMNWNGYICTKNQLSCDICTEFRRIKPQYCRRCGETIKKKKKKDMCDKCKTQRKKQYQRKYMALKNINNEEINKVIKYEKERR